MISSGCFGVVESSDYVEKAPSDKPRDDEIGSLADMRNIEPIESDLHCGSNVNTYLAEVPSVAVDAIGDEIRCKCVGCTTEYASGRVKVNNRCTFEYPYLDRLSDSERNCEKLDD